MALLRASARRTCWSAPLFVLRGRAVALPPVYRVDLVAAPPDAERSVQVAAIARRRHRRNREAPVPKRAERTPSRCRSRRRADAAAPAPATPVPNAASAKRDAAGAKAGGGPEGGTGTDVANVEHGRDRLSVPGYLNNIVRQILLRFKPRNAREPRDGSGVPHQARRVRVSELQVQRGRGVSRSISRRRGPWRPSAARSAFGPLPAGWKDDVLPVIFTFEPRLVLAMSRCVACPRCLLCLTIVTVRRARRRAAQDTTFRQGVQLSPRYAPGTRPGIVVLPVAGAARGLACAPSSSATSTTATASPSSPPMCRPRAAASRQWRLAINYPLFAKLGADGLVQVTSAATRLRASLCITSPQQKIERTQDFALARPDGERGRPTGGLLCTPWPMSSKRGSQACGVSPRRGLLTRAGARIWQIDSDGANATALSGSAMAMSPAWHPRGSHMAYSLTGSSGNWQVHASRETGGATRTLGTTPGGQNITPVFSPDGNTLVYSHAREAGNDLYAVNPFAPEAAPQVTVGRGSDNMSPSFSPDGRQLAFTYKPDRPTEVYISDADGTNAEPLTSFSYRRPIVSIRIPTGRLTAGDRVPVADCRRFQLISIGLRDRAAEAA